MSMLARTILVLVLVGWLWEAAAILFDAWPTITDVVRAHRHHSAVVVVVAFVILAAASWALAHLLAVRR